MPFAAMLIPVGCSDDDEVVIVTPPAEPTDTHVGYTRAAGDTIPTVMEVFKGNDTLRCLTNFYGSPTMIGTTDG